jgi:hypothetical protein
VSQSDDHGDERLRELPLPAGVDPVSFNTLTLNAQASGRESMWHSDHFFSRSSPCVHPVRRRPQAHSRCMRRGARPLLCELHAHTTWSDGELSLGAVVDLYGTAGFDLLCVTDHVLRADDPWPLRNGRSCVDATNVGAYLAEIERERARALSAYGLLLVPGFELTYNDPNPDRAGHAVAVGLHSLVGMDDGPAAAMEQPRAAGAAILAAHPHDSGPTPAVPSPPATSRGAGGSCVGSSIAWSSSTGRICSAGSRRRDCRPSPAATCTGPNSFPAGRRSFPASRTSRRSSTICARPGQCS